MRPGARQMTSSGWSTGTSCARSCPRAGRKWRTTVARQALGHRRPDVPHDVRPSGRPRWIAGTTVRWVLVLLDLDGTLTDPYDGITRSVTYALDGLGLPRLEERQLRSFIGPPLQDQFAALGLDEGDVARAVELYRERFRDQGAPPTPLAPTAAPAKCTAPRAPATPRPTSAAETDRFSAGRGRLRVYSAGTCTGMPRGALLRGALPRAGGQAVAHARSSRDTSAGCSSGDR
jgi:hypothetical protein